MCLPASAEGVSSGPEARVDDGDGVLSQQVRRHAGGPRGHAVEFGVFAERRQQRRSDLRLGVAALVLVFVVVVVDVVVRLAHRIPPRRTTLRTNHVHASDVV